MVFDREYGYRYGWWIQNVLGGWTRLLDGDVCVMCSRKRPVHNLNIMYMYSQQAKFVTAS